MKLRQVHKLFSLSISVLKLLCQPSSIFVAGTASNEASTVAWGVTSKFAQWSPRNFPKCSILQVSTCGFSKCAGCTPTWLAVPDISANSISRFFVCLFSTGRLFVKLLVVCDHMFPWSEFYFFYDPAVCHFGLSEYLICRYKWEYHGTKLIICLGRKGLEPSRLWYKSAIGRPSIWDFYACMYI